MSAFLDVCRFTATSSGTGDFVVSAAVTGYQTPASAGAVNATVYTYRAESADLSQWEVGSGAYTVSGTTLARTTILFSSTGSKVSFSAAPQVAIVAAAEDLQSKSLTQSANTFWAGPSSGSAAVPAFRAIVGTEAAWTLISRQTASAASTLDFTSGISSTYSRYALAFDNVTLGTDAASFYLRVSEDAGSTWKTTGYNWSGEGFANDNTGTNLAQSSVGQIVVLRSVLGNTATSGAHGSLICNNPSSAAIYKNFTGYVGYVFTGTSGESVTLLTGRYVGDAGAITGIRFLTSAGTFSGNFALLGMRTA